MGGRGRDSHSVVGIWVQLTAGVVGVEDGSVAQPVVDIGLVGVPELSGCAKDLD